MAYFVYVLKSQTHQTKYIGCTVDTQKRLIEHNLGKGRYTSGRKPWSLIYKECYDTLVEARKREKFLKTGVERQELKRLLNL